MELNSFSSRLQNVTSENEFNLRGVERRSCCRGAKEWCPPAPGPGPGPSPVDDV